MTDQPSHLEPSELGTKSYWDECYVRELANHSHNPEDEGTVWFEDSAAEEKVIQLLEDLAEDDILLKTADNGGIATSFLDLGTGNGHFLFSLRDDGWTGSMLGVDYSEPSIRLARQILESRLQQNSEDSQNLNTLSTEFQELDLLSLDSSLKIQFDVMVDKGTFDALSLSSDVNHTGARISEQYRPSIKRFVKDNGLFIITSCNWTEVELKQWFEASDADALGRFVFEKRIKYPSFTFGGTQGQTVVTLCFRKLMN